MNYVESQTSGSDNLEGDTMSAASKSSESGSASDLGGLELATPAERNAIRLSKFTSLEEIAESTPGQVAGVLNDALADNAEPTAIEECKGVNSAMATQLREHEIETRRDLARADVDALKDVVGMGGRLRAAQQNARQQPHIITEEQAENLIEKADTAAIDTGEVLAKRSLDMWARNRGGGANVRKLDEQERVEADPVAVTRETDDLSQADTQYIAQYGSNEDDPEETGLQVLDLSPEEYPQIPVPDTHPDAGPDAIPTDQEGEPIPPAVPDEPILNRPIDELTAKDLAMGNPVCYIGHRGAGKNLVPKWIAYQTNRGYRSIDCDKSTMPISLFGPQTPDEDGVIIKRDGPLKRGLLNPDIVVLNEFSALQAGAAMALHRLLNEGKVLIKHHGELVEPHQGSCIVLGMNPPTIEYPGSEEPNGATKGRLEGYWFPYPEEVNEETETIYQQVAGKYGSLISRDAVERVVDFAHRTRRDENTEWPILSVRNVYTICENVATKEVPIPNAIHHRLRWQSRENQSISDAVGQLSEQFDDYSA
jgi:nitric oxide reductase NorQ protein